MRKTRELSRVGFIHLINQGHALISICRFSFKFFSKKVTIIFNCLGKILFSHQLFRKRLVLVIDRYVIRITKQEFSLKTKITRHNIRQFQVDPQDNELSGNS